MNHVAHNMVNISKSDNPDLDWSQVVETVRMLNLAVAQIAISLRDGDDSVAVLGEAFTSTANELEEVIAITNQISNDEQNIPIKSDIQERCTGMVGQMNSFVMAFQFYDKLTQRLAHVSHSLAQLGTLVSDHSRLYQPAEWQKLQEQIQSRYTMADEREMFSAIMNGATVEQALSAMTTVKQDGDGHADDIELF